MPAKTKCASLGAVALSTHNIEFYKDDNSKLRIKIQDTDNNDYDLRVTCKYLRDKFEKTKDVTELNEELQKASKAHVRIGLARPFVEKDNNCYLMCNGLFCF